MNGLDFLSEIFPIVFSSVGISGSFFAAIITVAIKKAKKDAEEKRAERLRLEILRLESEEKMSKLLFAMLKHSRGCDNERELDDAEEAYIEHLENSSRIKNEIIGLYTAN
jgi:hypothetical protein